MLSEITQVIAMTKDEKKEKIKLRLDVLDSVSNPNSIHGIYPYRGKISALDCEQVIQQLPTSGTLLDPFCGSGTILYEAKKHGLDVIGVDSNPIAIQICKGKLSVFDKNETFKHAQEIIGKIDLSRKLKMPEKAEKFFHPDTANQIMHLKEYYDEFSDYEKAVFLGTVCLAARGCNNYAWSSTQIGTIKEKKRYIDFYSKYFTKLKKHAYPLDKDDTKIIQGDSRGLSKYMKRGSVGYVYTSPPYFDALDYTSNYTRIVHNIFENDIREIKNKLMQNYETYAEDIKKCFEEIDIVTKSDALIIFVVGDKKIKGKVINGGDFFKSIIPHKPSYIVERKYTGTASKIWDSINKTDRKEQIIVWDKSTW